MMRGKRLREVETKYRYIIRKRVLGKMGHIYPACQDVENEAMLRFVKVVSEGKVKNILGLKTYIKSIADCVIANYFKKIYYKEIPARLRFLGGSVNVNDPLASVEAKEIIEESFKVLSDEEKKAIAYTEIHRMSYVETAKMMGITKERLGLIKTDAKRKIKRRLVKMGFGATISLDAEKRIEGLAKKRMQPLFMYPLKPEEALAAFMKIDEKKFLRAKEILADL